MLISLKQIGKTDLLATNLTWIFWKTAYVLLATLNAKI